MIWKAPVPNISSKNAVSRQAKRDSTDTYSLPPVAIRPCSKRYTNAPASGGTMGLVGAMLTKSRLVVANDTYPVKYSYR